MPDALALVGQHWLGMREILVPVVAAAPAVCVAYWCGCRVIYCTMACTEILAPGPHLHGNIPCGRHEEVACLDLPFDFAAGVFLTVEPVGAP